MRRFLLALLCAFPALALAHPGHGGSLLHLHGDWAALGLAAAGAALVAWLGLRK